MKKLILTLGILLLSGCSNSVEKMYFPALPLELADCNIFKVSNENGSHITIARCPNSTTSTTYKSGKSKATSIVVDGIHYEKSE